MSETPVLPRPTLAREQCRYSTQRRMGGPIRCSPGWLDSDGPPSSPTELGRFVHPGTADLFSGGPLPDRYQLSRASLECRSARFARSSGSSPAPRTPPLRGSGRRWMSPRSQKWSASVEHVTLVHLSAQRGGYPAHACNGRTPCVRRGRSAYHAVAFKHPSTLPFPSYNACNSSGAAGRETVRRKWARAGRNVATVCQVGNISSHSCFRSASATV